MKDQIDLGHNQVDLGHVGRGVLRRWGSIAFGLGSVLAFVVVLTRYTPKSYESESTILVAPRGWGVDAPALEVLQRLGRGNSIETEIELLQSRRVLEPTVESLDLNASVRLETGIRPAREVFSDFVAAPDAVPGTYRFAQDSVHNWIFLDDSTKTVIGRFHPREKVAAHGLSFTAPSDSSRSGVITVVPVSRAVGAVQRRIGAKLVHREANLILLSCQARSASAAHDLCQSTAENYIDLRRNLQRGEAASTAAFLRTQVARIGLQLRVAEDSLQAFRRRGGEIVLQEQASAEVRDVAGLGSQREQIEAERAALSDLIAKVTGKGGSEQRYFELATFPTLFKNASVTSLLESMVDLQNQRTDLAVRRQDKNPDLAAVDGRIAEIQRQLLATATGYETGLATQIRALDRALVARETHLAALPMQQIESVRRERQVGLLAALHQSLELRLREAEVGEAVDLPSVEIADSASMPVSPSSPKVRVNLALGLILGLGYGFGIALVKEHRDTRIYDWGLLEERTRLPVLALIPRLGRVGPLLDVRSTPATNGTSVGSSSSPPIARIPNRKGRGDVVQTVTAKRGGDADLALEAFRSLGAELLYPSRDVGSGLLSSVAITSAGPREGKTITACNLALARAASGTRTLLMDCDFRASGVSAFFDLPRRARGLTEVLRGSANLAEVSRELQLPGEHKLTVLPAGAVWSDGGRLLESKQFIELVQGLAAHFDLIVVDTPPLTILTDASAVVRAVDGVLVVVRKGVTDQPALELMLERLRRIGHPPIGLVFGAVAMPKPYLRYMEPAG